MRENRTLARSAAHPSWHPSIETLPSQPLILVGNELFDTLPVRQYVKTPSGWRERVVGLDEQRNLAFLAGPGAPDDTLLPPGAANAPEGAVVEFAPARTALMEAVARRLAANGGAALFVDYGYGEPAIGDTLQAVRRHQYDDVLAHPGEADLTAHVDFAALAAVARSRGLKAFVTTQGDFLLRLGLLERAGALGAAGDKALQEKLTADVNRLAGPDGMGALFKVLEVTATR